jgi:PAS domain S-box-containing protein
VSRKEPFHGARSAGSEVLSMSTDMSVPRPRLPGLDVSDSALLSSLLEEAPVGFAFIGPDLRILRLNKAMASLLGREDADEAGRTPAEVWPSDLAEAARTAIGRVLAGEPLAPQTEHVIAVPPGEPPEPVSNGAAPGPASAPGAESVRYLSVSWFASGDGDVRGVALIAVDRTQQYLAAEALRRSEERYRSLVQAGAQVVWVTRPDGSIAEDSPEWRWITGQTAEEYSSDGWLDAIHADDRERVEAAWQECVRTGKVFDSRYRVRSRTGSYRHYDVRAVPIERDGRIIEWMGASTDVTAQREAEEMRGRLTEQLSAAALRTARLQQATSMLAEALTVEQVVQVITEVGRSAIGAERSAVAILDTDRLRVTTINPAGLPVSPGSPASDMPLSVPSVMTLAISTRHPVLLESPDAYRRLFEAESADASLFLAHSDEKAWVGLPLLSSGAALGGLRFSFSRPRQITEEERVFLEALAGQCALALERATLYEREHTTAETLQRSLLPDTLPTVPGMILEARCMPVTRNMEIGGDWYDAFRLPDGRLAVATGDVMGKGLTAAAGMGRVRNALRALALSDPRPAAVLSGLDRLFLATELAEQVTTVAYLVVDPRTGDGVAGNAGHLPPLLLSADRPPRLESAEAGTPLGWASPRRQYAFRLPPGNTAVLYSDGLVENRRRGLDVGLDELVAVAAAAPAGVTSDPARLLGYLVDRMLTGYEQDDDVTVLVLHVPADPDRAGGPRAAGSARKGRA